jgi:dTDP-4-dehydrorhamnose 3,5-epimerase
MTRFTIHNTNIVDLKIIERHEIGDSRGYLSRIFCKEELSLAGWSEEIVQINFTYSKKMGTIRGLHYQLTPYTEFKLVTCLKGAIWDVAVDLRFGSPTFLKWHAEILSDDNKRALLIPKGFAHGFQTLSDDCELIYLHSKQHTPHAEAGINIMDEVLSINWPLASTVISNRDQLLPKIDPKFKGVQF